ncbi:MAG: hypothetical protein IJ877_04645 [Candidatus Gastranaerophilales bacterium]|nr:hypothetical protein [Candidatus Gastranaerophilales bacterium]
MVEEKKRFTILIDNNIYEKFKKLAEKETRSAGNLASKLIIDYVREHEKEL